MRRHVRQAGFTLVELMGAVLISIMVIFVLYSLFDKVQDVFMVSQNRSRVLEQGRVAMDILTKDFKGLSAARQFDQNGEVPNIEWVGGAQAVNEVGYLSPVRPFNIEGFEEDTGILQVANPLGPRVGDIVYAVNGNPRFGPGAVINATDKHFAYLVPSQNGPVNPFMGLAGTPGLHEPPPEVARLEVHMEAISYDRWQFYTATAQNLHRHHCRFFSNDEGWRFVDYKFGGRENYKRMDPASPIGALWVYRSRVVPRSGLLAERLDHESLKMHDPSGRKLTEPVGYSRVLDGVLHFRVRAVSSADPGRALASPTVSFFAGERVPSHVEVELMVADEKLVDEMENAVEQRMENIADPRRKYDAKLKHLADNLDRVYFFKQLIRVGKEDQ